LRERKEPGFAGLFFILCGMHLGGSTASACPTVGRLPLMRAKRYSTKY
jgi:hypothetical protein